MNNREKTATTLVHSVNAHTRIRLDEMDKPGTYIISFWNDKPLANGLHTVAVSYNGSSIGHIIVNVVASMMLK